MTVFNHTGQVVTDLDRSTAFYEALGFTVWYEISPPDDLTAKLNGLTPPLGTTARYLTLGDFVLELLHYSAPGVTTAHRARTMADPGLTHLSIAVDDVAVTARQVGELGGEVIVDSDLGVAVFVRDPDGQLLELLPAGYRDHLPPRP